MPGDLLGPALRGDVLRSNELRATTPARKAQQVFGYHRYRPAGTLLPRRIGCRVDDNLTNDAPTIVVRVAPRDEKSSKRLGNLDCLGLGRVTIEMPQRGLHAATFVDCPRELGGSSPARLW